MSDAYGGDTERQFEKTGFFRLEKKDRWWLVTPEGHAFLSWGINHVGVDVVTRPYNREFWLNRFGGVQDPKDPVFLQHFQKKVERDMAEFGFNTLGCHSPVQIYPNPFCPYIESIRFAEICHWQTPGEDAFVDVFSEAFQTHCDGLAARKAGPKKDDPYLIGYSFIDGPVLTDLDAAERDVCVYGNARQALPTWPRVLRNLGPGAPAKHVYVETMRGRYKDDIAAFNTTYQTEFGSFDALLAAERWRPAVDVRNHQEVGDNLAFLGRVVDRYYRVATGAIKRYDPNHLILGDKLNMNTGVPVALVRTVAEWVDVLFYQHYGYYGEQQPHLDKWAHETQKPLLNGDSAFSVQDAHMPFPLGPHLPNQHERSRAFTDYATKAFARHDYLGWNWCGWIDSWAVSQPGRQHSGIQTAQGAYYDHMQKAMKAFSEHMYELAGPSA
ncbi:MAG: hypothetical protein JXR37_11500 [Kiritimatiellae bacterium]|nr:hypothetical protein [Kiritimatiellia bacterium]